MSNCLKQLCVSALETHLNCSCETSQQMLSFSLMCTRGKLNISCLLYTSKTEPFIFFNGHNCSGTGCWWKTRHKQMDSFTFPCEIQIRRGEVIFRGKHNSLQLIIAQSAPALPEIDGLRGWTKAKDWKAINCFWFWFFLRRVTLP